jgi:hypothetical protein
MADDKFNLPTYSKAAPFPRERFLVFLSRLKVQSKDYGLVGFQLLGSQRYIMERMIEALEKGITTFVILKARQIGCCHDPSMRVLTADLRWCPIGEIGVGDRLVAVDEHSKGIRGRGRRMQTCEVLGLKEVERQAVEIVLDDGTTLIATAEHPYLCKKRGGTEAVWQRVAKLRLGDEIRCITTVWGDPDLEDAWMSGLADGEGCLRAKPDAGCELTISQTEGAVLDRASKYFVEKGYTARREIDDRPSGSSKLGSRPVHKLVVGRMQELFRFLGVTKPSRFHGNEWWVGKELPGKRVGEGWRKVVSLRILDVRRMVDLHTSTGTYICEGVVSHNTTFFLALDVFWAFEYRGLLGVFIIHEEPARDDWRQAIEVFYDEIPKTVTIDGRKLNFKPRKLRHNRNLLSFSNGSRFRYLIAGTGEGRKGGIGRSGAANYVHATEVAFYGNEDDIRAFKSSTSSLYAHRLQIYESTANGYNHFYDTCENAKVSTQVAYIFVGWWLDERNQFPIGDPRYRDFMQDASLTVAEKKRVRAVKELYGFVVTLQQIAWYRWKRRDEFDDDQQMMDQEFPWTEEDAFQATGSKYFTGETLTAAIKEARKSPFQGYRYKLTNRWEDTVVQGFKDQRAELRIWEHASRFGYYVIGCDPAYGSSDEADRSVVSVWRAYAECVVQVAEFCTSVVSTYQCAWVLAHLAGFYGIVDCRVIIEISGPGTAVWQELMLLQQHLREIRPQSENSDLRNIFKNMKQFFYNKPDSVGSSDFAFHWRMTEDLKRQLMAKFKDSFELGRLIPRSVPLLDEMRRIVNDEGHIAAEGAHKDDRVIAAALAHESWRRWLQPILRGLNMTRERASKIETAGGDAPINTLILNYLRKANISLPAQRELKKS